PALIPRDSRLRARAGALRVPVVAARTWIHGCHQQEACREGGGATGAGDRDHTRLERVTQGLEGRAAELREFVEEPHTTAREADLSGTHVRAAAHEPGVGDRVVWRAERPPVQQWRIA